MEHSLEFFPPKGADAATRFEKTVQSLLSLKPTYGSVTYGAGGTTRERTFAAVKTVMEQGLEAVPHLTCIGTTRTGVREILSHYQSQGIKRIVALRGDLPEEMEDPGELTTSIALIEEIRAFGGFQIIVSAYPESHPKASSPLADLDFFVNKVKAGAHSAVTQYFFNPDAFFQFRDDVAKRGITIPVYVGVMPLANFSQIARFSAMCGAEIPRYIRQRMEAYGEDKQAQYEFGIEVMTRQCEQYLKAGVPGLHFYSLNRAEPTATIWRNLALS